MAVIYVSSIYLLKKKTMSKLFITQPHINLNMCIFPHDLAVVPNNRAVSSIRNVECLHCRAFEGCPTVLVMPKTFQILNLTLQVFLSFV